MRAPALLPTMLAAVLLAGCGSAATTGRSTTAAGGAAATGASSAAAAAASACGNLRARLHGIRVREGIEDPAPATLRGRRPVRIVRRAAREGDAATREVAAELAAAHASSAAAALLPYEAVYRRLLASLAAVPTGTADDGIRLEGRLIRINAAEERSCFAATGS